MQRPRVAVPPVVPPTLATSEEGPTIEIPPYEDAPVTDTGSFGPDVVLEEIDLTIRGDQWLRNVFVSPHDPDTAFVTSWQGYVFKTEDGGKTWDESRLIVHRRPFFGDQGQMLHFGRMRFADPPTGDPHPFLPVDIHGRARHILGGDGAAGAGGGVEQAERPAMINQNIGVGLPGSAPRLQNWLVRKFGKPTSGLNIKQTLLTRGFIPTEIRRVMVHPTDPQIVFAASFYGLFKSWDGGLSWVRVFAGGSPKETKIHWVTVDPLDDQRVLIGTEDGLFSSPDGGETFTKSGAQGVGSGDVTHILFYPHDPRIVLAATHNGVLRSPDGGWNWEFIYYTTYTPARMVRHIAVDFHEKRRAYIGTFDGAFETHDIVSGSLEDWQRLAGTTFVGQMNRRILSCPTHKGHMWVHTQIKHAALMVGGFIDTGVNMLWETVDGGKTFRVIYTNNTGGNIMWFAPDGVDPDLLWIASTWSLVRLRRVDRTQIDPAREREILPVAQDALNRLPPYTDVLMAAMRFHGGEITQRLELRRRILYRPLVPRVSLTYAQRRSRGYNLTDDFMYIRAIPFRRNAEAALRQSDWRVMLTWDLSDSMFHIERVLYGRMFRLNEDVRGSIWGGVSRYYSELQRLVARLAVNPPTDPRIRLVYKLRVEELHSHLDFKTGGYLTRYAQGDRPLGMDTPWFKKWDGVTSEWFPQPAKEWTVAGMPW